MSREIVTALRIRSGFEVVGKCGSSNVRPFSATTKLKYTNIDEFMSDLLDNVLDISRLKTLTAKKVNQAIQKVIDKHEEVYGSKIADQNYSWYFNPYSLWRVKGVYHSSKSNEKYMYIKRAFAIANQADGDEVQMYQNIALVTRDNYDEFVKHYKELIEIFKSYV